MNSMKEISNAILKKFVKYRDTFTSSSSRLVSADLVHQQSCESKCLKSTLTGKEKVGLLSTRQGEHTDCSQLTLDDAVWHLRERRIDEMVDDLR